MKTTVLVVISVVLVLLGATWTLQGIGVLKGSVMTGVTLWAVIGPILILAGVATAIFGVRGRRTTP
jgi:hypothetical protein